MPASRAAISSVSVLIASFALSMAVSSSATLRSKTFFLSSALSNWELQYSTLWSSSSCSCLRVATISPIILITFSKPIFLLRRASEMKSRRAASGRLRTAFRRARAFARNAALLARICTKLEEALGSVFLKRSSASSSLSTLMVSARATSSSARVFLISSHSAVFVSQLFCRPSLNFVSSPSASCVSTRSFSMPEISTPRSPTRVISVSIWACSVATSFFFAAISAS
mmetsp:Transcript_64506/g.165988  ORF Transcript_64506/g.165988 Transcript_64506/m.165988 type:complete len:227 (-) Transcript_64506:771-1451(-)